jgi:uncharacterized protein
MTMSQTIPTKRGCRYWRNLGLFALLASFMGFLFFLYVGHPYFYSRGWAHPNSPAVCCVTPADRGFDYQSASFVTRDGLTLRGWYIPSQNGAAIILAHGMGANRLAVLDTAEVLARNGYGVLMFDLRAHGESDGDLLPFGGDEAEDLYAAANFLAGQPGVEPSRIGAMGFSLGAQVSILGTMRTEAIRALVADAPCCTTFEDMPAPHTLGDWLWVPYDLVFFWMLHWHTGVPEPVSVQEAIGTLAPRPILLIGGGSERNLLQHHMDAAQEPKELWIIPEAGHIGGLSARPEEYEERVVGFFDKWLFDQGP